MLKKALLTTLLTLSTIASAHINLNLDLTIANDIGTYYTAQGDVIVEENTPTSIELDDAGRLIMNVHVTQEDKNIVIQTQLIEKINSNPDEFEIISEPVIAVALNETGTITLSNDNNDVLTLSITPTLVE